MRERFIYHYFYPIVTHWGNKMRGRNITNLFAVLFLLVLASISATEALQEDFYISGSNKVTSCAHGISTESITIRNTGSISTGYSISKSGSAAPFASYSEQFFSLNPGEERTIQVYLTPGTEKGSHSLTTTVQTTFGLTKKVKQDIQVKNCANLNLVIITPVVNVDPCNPAHFKVEVKNTGSFIESYHFSVDKFSEYSAISELMTVLGPGESRIIDLFVNPACEIYGEHEIKFSALAETSKFLGTVPLKLDIARAYEYKVDVPENIKVCRFERSTVDVSVENLADLSNVYDLKVSGPGWVTIDHDNLFLGAKQNTKTHLNLTPTKAGEYDIKIEAKSRRGDLVKSGERTVTVEECYRTEVYIEKRTDVLVGGESKSYPAIIKNTGTKDDTYTLELQAPFWARLVPGDYSVSSEKEKSTDLEIDIPNNVTGDYKITVKASSDYVFAEDSIIIDVISQKKAYNVLIDPDSTRVDFGKDEVIVNLKQRGLRASEYDISLIAPSWVDLSDDEVELGPGEEKAIKLETDRDSEGSYEIELRVAPKNKGVAFVSKFNINVGPAWYEKVGSFLWLYKLYFGLGLLVLGIVIPGIIYAPRILKRIADKRKISEELRKIKELTELEEIGEVVRKSSGWKKIITILGIVVAIGLVVSSIFLIPSIDLFKFKEDYKSIISIDRSGLSGSGNTIVVNDFDEFFIPLVIENNYENDLVFDIDEKVSWIKATKDQVEVKAGESEIVDLLITPAENIEENDYKVDVSVELTEGGEILKEFVTLKIKKTTFWQETVNFFVKYWVYLLTGLIILVPVLIITHKKTKKEGAPFVEKKGKLNVKLSKK
ncbi:hypothetical protein ACFLZ7_03240 [Nanoarchaeota archaeon]